VRKLPAPSWLPGAAPLSRPRRPRWNDRPGSAAHCHLERLAKDCPFYERLSIQQLAGVPEVSDGLIEVASRQTHITSRAAKRRSVAGAAPSVDSSSRQLNH
jgi:hypothetical protein